MISPTELYLSITLATLITLSLPHFGSGHISLTFPPARYPPLDFLDSARTVGPCGVPAPLNDKGEAVYTTLVAGESYNVTWKMSMMHEGGFKIFILDSSGQPLRQLTAYKSGAFTGGEAPSTTSFSITIPVSLKCDKCILQLEREAIDQAQNYWFWSCADVTIVRRYGTAEGVTHNLAPSLNACFNHGHPTPDGGCICDRLFFGEFCQYKDDCQSDDDCGFSQNGRCVTRDTDEYPRRVCYCAPGRFGDNCHKKFHASDEDRAYDCFNYDYPKRMYHSFWTVQADVEPLPEQSTAKKEPIRYNLFRPNCYNNRTVGKDGDVIYWRRVRRDIEFIIEVSGRSWLSLGWRPPNTMSSCQSWLVKHKSPTATPTNQFYEKKPDPKPKTDDGDGKQGFFGPPRDVRTGRDVDDVKPTQIDPVFLEGPPKPPQPLQPPPRPVRPRPSGNSESLNGPLSNRDYVNIMPVNAGTSDFVWTRTSTGTRRVPWYLAQADIQRLQQMINQARRVFRSRRVKRSDQRRLFGRILGHRRPTAPTPKVIYYQTWTPTQEAQPQANRSWAEWAEKQREVLLQIFQAANTPEELDHLLETWRENTNINEVDQPSRPQERAITEGAEQNEVDGKDDETSEKVTNLTEVHENLHAMDCTDIVYGSVLASFAYARDAYTPSQAAPLEDAVFGGEDSLEAVYGLETNDGKTMLMFRKRLKAYEQTDQDIVLDDVMHLIWAKGHDTRSLDRTSKRFYRPKILKYHGPNNRETLNIKLFE